MTSQLEAAFGMKRLRQLLDAAMPGPSEITAYVEEASRISRDILEPLDRTIDEEGCTLVNGRVRLPQDFHRAWTLFREGGWLGVDVREELGGSGLPTAVAIAVQEMFDRGSTSFGMAPGASRAAIGVIDRFADSSVAKEWIPNLVSGDWTCTIAISEPDAGSDIGRLKTAARWNGETWQITGEKLWTSYGDHDLGKRIGHLVLARTQPEDVGISGLSLFLVPDVFGNGKKNSVWVRGLERKLGLHGSPTCAMGFEDAQGQLIGEKGRGLQQLFSMIVAMRLQVGSQGVAIATSCFEVALDFACERRQGGPAEFPPVAIVSHPDVQLMLAAMASRIVTMRGLVNSAAVANDLVNLETDQAARDSSRSLREWLLPIIKNGAAELAFETASEAVLVLGGAGYTKDWPIERHLRNSRVLAVYEGTTGMQAQDLVRRRWIPVNCGYEQFVRLLEAECQQASPEASPQLHLALNTMQEITTWLRDPANSPRVIASASRAALALATEVAQTWIASRLVRFSSEPSIVKAAEHALYRFNERGEALKNAIYGADRKTALLAGLTGNA